MKPHPPIISEFINIDSQIWVWYSFFYFVGGIFFLPFLWISTFLYLPYLVLFILATAYTHFYLIFSISGRLKEIKPRITLTPILGVLFQYLYLRNGLRALHWNFQTNLILLSWSAIRFTFEVSVIAVRDRAQSHTRIIPLSQVPAMVSSLHSLVVLTPPVISFLHSLVIFT